jgi:hypothetical protein
MTKTRQRRRACAVQRCSPTGKSTLHGNLNGDIRLTGARDAAHDVAACSILETRLLDLAAHPKAIIA